MAQRASERWYLVLVLGLAGVLTFIGRDWLPEGSVFTWGVGFASSAAVVLLVAALVRVQQELQSSRRWLERQQAELNFAREVQAALFPKRLPEGTGLGFAAVCIPAEGISGDYYDVIRTQDGRLVFLIADVSGKGVPAAILMANLHGRLRALVETNVALDEVCRILNRHLVTFTEARRFATLFIAQRRAGAAELEFVNAGHELPFCFGSEFQCLEEGGPPLGLLENVEYELGRAPLEAGELIALYSDGVTEAMNEEGEEFGSERLKRILAEHAERPLAEIQNAVLREIREWTGGRLTDDVTLMLVRVRS
ncbi:MAG: hypothetical protein Kow00109_05610 [Acidobacteriota bacterium]